MGSIVGALSKKGDNVSKIIVDMLKITEHRGPDGVGICIGRKVTSAKSPEKIDTDELGSNIGMGCAILNTLTEERLEKPIMSYKDYFIVFNGEINNHQEFVRKFCKVDEVKRFTDGKIILCIFDDFLKKYDLIKAVRKTLDLIDGIYSFAIIVHDKLIIARDPVGTKPLYFGENGRLIIFASERKALWAIGITNEIYSLKPGNFAIISRDGIFNFRGSILKKKPPFKMTFKKSRNGVSERLLKSMEKLTKYKKLGALFSGGLDSYLIAYYAKSLGVDIELFCCGFEGSKDVLNAVDSADKIDLPLHVYELDLYEIEEYLPRILYAIEERNPMNLSIAIPIFFSTRLAKKRSIRVMLSGQGSDEMFGGYARYESIVTNQGYQGLYEQLWRDIMNIADKNLQRDDAASMANGVEIRSPYLDFGLIEYAMKIPSEYKIRRKKSNYVRKYILRSVAKNLGIPKDVVNRTKIATQYGSGSWKALQKLARKNGFSKQIAQKQGYTDHIHMYLDDLSFLSGLP